jgi:hypothetical protein
VCVCVCVHTHSPSDWKELAEGTCVVFLCETEPLPVGMAVGKGVCPQESMEECLQVLYWEGGHTMCASVSQHMDVDDAGV